MSVLSERDYADCLRTLNTGGFVCLLPQQIDPEWGGVARRIAGFPINVRFTGLSSTSKQKNGGTSVVTSTYRFDHSFYFENENSRRLTYLPELRSDYRVELTFNKKNQSWEGRKFLGLDELSMATGPEFRRFMIQLTMGGVRVDEPTADLRTLDVAGHGGIYMWVPDAKRPNETGSSSEEVASDSASDKTTLPWFMHSIVNPPTDPLTVQLTALVENLDSIEGPKTVGPENYSRISRAFMERGWTGFEVEFDRAVTRDHPEYATLKRDLLRAPLFRLQIHYRMARLADGTLSAEDALSEANRDREKRKPSLR